MVISNSSHGFYEGLSKFFGGPLAAFLLIFYPVLAPEHYSKECPFMFVF